MNLIQGVTSDPLQQLTIILPNGNSVTFQLYFMPIQYAWVMPSITYQNFTLQGLRVVNTLNLLNQYANQLPFGIGCISMTGRDPQLQQDFSSGFSNLYVLTQSEVTYFQTYLASNGN